MTKQRHTPKVVDQIGNYAMIPEWVVKRSVKHTNAGAMVLVYSYLAFRARRSDNTCFPKKMTIAKELEMSISTVGRAVDALFEIGAVEWFTATDKRGWKTTNVYTVIQLEPPNNGVYEGSGRVTHDTSGSVTHDTSDRSPMTDLNKNQFNKNQSNEEPKWAAPSAQPPDEEDELVYRDSDQEGDSSLRSRKREPRVIPSGYIQKRKAPRSGNLFLAQYFAQQASVGLTDWVWQLTSSSPNDPSKTNDAALAKTIGVWKDQHGWTDKDVQGVIDKFIAMVGAGRITVSNKTIEPWRVFVSNIDRVVAAQKDTTTKIGTAEGWVKKVHPV